MGGAGATVAVAVAVTVAVAVAVILVRRTGEQVKVPEPAASRVLLRCDFLPESLAFHTKTDG